MKFELEAYGMHGAFELAKRIPFYVAEGIFQYGSTVYKNKKPDDIDIIVVYSSNTTTDDIQFKSSDYNINAYHISKFATMLAEHRIDALECLFLPTDAYSYISPILKNIFKTFVLDKEILRRSISATSSNSYSKAKKKLVVQEDYDLESSIKSIWHSFRIMDYGVQLAENNKITNFLNSNSLFAEIIQTYMNSNCDWETIHQQYKPKMNALHSKFKELCPLRE